MISTVFIQDCPNEFKPYNNKCYRWFTQNKFSEHVKNCDLQSGKLLSTTFEPNDAAILVAREMMDANSANEIYLGKLFVCDDS